MYAQYNQYAPQGAVAATQQPGVTWNGSAWVPNAAPQGPGAHSSYASVVSSSITPSAQAAESISAKYTDFYNRWMAHKSSQEALAQSLAQGSPAQQEAVRQAAWAKHYADQSSAAAHYYHPQGVKHSSQPPPLPPEPPRAAAVTTITAAKAVAVPAMRKSPVAASAQAAPAPSLSPARGSARAAPVHKPPPSSSSSSATTGEPTKKNESPGGLKRFVHRCLMACGNDAKKRELMQSKIQGVIAAALQSQTLHTTNWDDREVLKLEEPVTKKSEAGAPKRSHSVAFAQSNDNHYGPSSNGDGEPYDRFSKSSLNCEPEYSYYGRTTPSETSSVGSSSEKDFVSLSPFSRSRKKKKKNKNSSSSTSSNSHAPLARSNSGLDNSSYALLKRANRFSGPGGIHSSAAASPKADNSLAKFMGKETIGGKSKLGEADYEKMTVKGTCTALEKDYLRLTAPPRAELVRPQPILEQHLLNLKVEWKRKDRKRDYLWFCSQLKAIRQDLTVQRIFNSFALDVYETHARIALEEGDLNEYNQCQTQLKDLYETHPDSPRVNEFVAYRILYYVLQTYNKKYREGSKDLFQIMLHLSPEQQRHVAISHALQVRVAVTEMDYHAFFRLYKDSTTSHGKFLMEAMIPNVRQSALYRICKVYRPSVSVNFVLAELGFDNEAVGRPWLESCGCQFDGDDLLTKDSVVRESDLKSKRSSLI